MKTLSVASRVGRAENMVNADVVPWDTSAEARHAVIRLLSVWVDLRRGEV